MPTDERYGQIGVMESYRVYKNVLLPSEVDAIVKACKAEDGWIEGGVTQPNHLYASRVRKKVRSCRLKTLPEEINEPICLRLSSLVKDVWTEFSFDGQASDEFGLQNRGAFVMMKYRAGDHFVWHSDRPKGETGITNFISKRRRVSVTIIVQDCESGGELQFKNPEEETVRLSSRDCVLFPSEVIHRVKPIEQGERISLVGWYGLLSDAKPESGSK